MHHPAPPRVPATPVAARLPATLKGAAASTLGLQTPCHWRAGKAVTASAAGALPERLAELLQCPACAQPAYPVSVMPQCGHLMCERCAGAWLARTAACPLCRAPADATLPCPALDQALELVMAALIATEQSTPRAAALSPIGSRKDAYSTSPKALGGAVRGGGGDGGDSAGPRSPLGALGGADVSYAICDCNRRQLQPQLQGHGADVGQAGVNGRWDGSCSYDIVAARSSEGGCHSDVLRVHGRDQGTPSCTTQQMHAGAPCSLPAAPHDAGISCASRDVGNSSSQTTDGMAWAQRIAAVASLWRDAGSGAAGCPVSMQQRATTMAGGVPELHARPGQQRATTMAGGVPELHARPGPYSGRRHTVGSGALGYAADQPLLRTQLVPAPSPAMLSTDL
eukprot:365840-Chlamydomonas_euryale.AAC.10